MRRPVEEPRSQNIELSLPINPAYVSAARLTASAVASRMRFDIDEIEDVKAAVSEACNYIINRAPEDEAEMFKILLKIDGDTLNIKLSSKTCHEHQTDDEMCLMMVKALVDNVEIELCEGSRISFYMVKTHKTQLF